MNLPSFKKASCVTGLKACLLTPKGAREKKQRQQRRVGLNPFSLLQPLSTCLLLAFIAGCAAGPNYKAPKTAVPDTFAGGAETNFSSGETAIAWWRGFNDTRLNQLVDRALAGNHDLQAATANVLQARAMLREAQFDFLPVPEATAGYTRSLYSQAFEPGVPRSQRNLKLYDAGFDATWELDFFGHVRRQVQAGTAEWQAAEAG